MRKFVLASAVLFCSVGLLMAERMTFVSFKDGTLKVKSKSGDEKALKVDAKTTFKSGDKDLDNSKGVARLEKMESGGKASGKAKLDVTTDGKHASEVKFPARKKKKN